MNMDKSVFNLSQRFDLRSSDKHVALQNVSIYYTWKNITKQYKNNKFKIIAPTWNDEFELPDGSYSEFLLFMFTSIELIIDQCLK